MRNDSSNNRLRGRRGQSFLCAIVLWAFALPLWGRVGTPPHSLERAVRPLAAIQRIVLTPTDVQAELTADRNNGNHPPLRYAVPQKVFVTPATHGTWEQLSDGRLWRLRIVSAGATDLNLGFTTFLLPEGATLPFDA